MGKHMETFFISGDEIRRRLPFDSYAESCREQGVDVPDSEFVAYWRDVAEDSPCNFCLPPRKMLNAQIAELTEKVKVLTMQLDQMRENVGIAYDVGEGRAKQLYGHDEGCDCAVCDDVAFRESLKKKLTEKDVIVACRDAGFTDLQWRAMTFESGPYDITEAKLQLLSLAQILSGKKITHELE